jgi:hypothetical protein
MTIHASTYKAVPQFERKHGQNWLESDGSREMFKQTIFSRINCMLVSSGILLLLLNAQHRRREAEVV